MRDFCNRARKVSVLLIVAISISRASEANLSLAPNKLGKLTSLECNVRIVGEKTSDLLEESFIVLGQGSPGHGALERSYSNSVHEVVVMANKKWMGIAWWKSGKKVAETQFAQTDEEVKHRALLLFNPEDENDQASLDCLSK